MSILSIISLSFIVIVSLAISLSLEQTQVKPVNKQKFKISPFDLLLEAERNGLRGIYVIHWLLDDEDNWLNDKDENYIPPVEIKLIVPGGSRPRWSPQRNYILYERYGWICVMNRKGKTIQGWMHSYPVYGWGPDENTILIGSYRETSDPRIPKGLGFKTLWKEPWEAWEEKELYEPAIGVPAQYGIAFPHPQLPDELWLGNPTMSPDWTMHAFEAYRPISDCGRNYSKIYIVEWVSPPQSRTKDFSWLPIQRLTHLPDNLLEVNPKFSPYGKWIAFEVIDPKTFTHRVYVATPDGKTIQPIPLPSKIGEVDLSSEYNLTKIYYEHIRYRIIKWIDKEKLLIQSESMVFDESDIRFWLLDLTKNDWNFLFSIQESQKALVVIDKNRKFAVIYNAPTPYYLSASLEIMDLDTKKRHYIKEFPKDMIVYWMDW